MYSSAQFDLQDRLLCQGFRALCTLLFAHSWEVRGDGFMSFSRTGFELESLGLFPKMITLTLCDSTSPCTSCRRCNIITKWSQTFFHFHDMHTSYLPLVLNLFRIDDDHDFPFTLSVQLSLHIYWWIIFPKGKKKLLDNSIKTKRSKR